MRGVYFHSEDDVNNKDFIKIFNNINLDNYRMKIGYQEFYNSKNGGQIEICEEIRGSKFLKFCNDNNFYTIFLEMFIYEKNDYIEKFPKDYNEYMKSPCKMALFIVDSASIEIYSKDDNITKTIMKNISDKRYSDQEYTTDENDGRTRFSVW